VTWNEQPFERALLARYAAYPLQEGNLVVDAIGLKYNYYDRSQNGNIDEEDPFFGFFQQLTPKAGRGQSERLTVKVLPLPAADRPASFTGGVGKFEVATAVDRYELHANEALRLTVKVEGQGNVTTLQEPKIQLPEELELYDVKSRLNRGRGGAGEKFFEYVIIPRKAGAFQIPSIDLGFFDPNKKEYYVNKSEPIQLKVLEPAPGSYVAPAEAQKVDPSASLGKKKSRKNKELRPLKFPLEEAPSFFSWLPPWRLLYWAFSAALGALFALVGIDFLKRKTGYLSSGLSQGGIQTENWHSLQIAAENASKGAPLQSVIEA
jgi:hypothetical protein